MTELKTMNPDTAPSANPMRVHVLAPTGQDGDVLSKTLREAGIDAEPCGSMQELCALIDGGVGAAVIAAEALLGKAAECLKRTLARQPEWSDLPLVIMTIRRNMMGPGWAFVSHADMATHALVLERPVYGATLVSAVRSSLTSRMRQYQVRDEFAERRRVEAELRESEERFRTLADNMSQFAWMADPEGRIFWYNRRWFEFTGTSSEELRSAGWWSVHHPDHLERVRHRYYECVGAGRRWEDTFQLRGHDGQYRWFLSHAVPIRDERGEVLRWFGTNTDITEILNTQDALKRTLDRVEALKEESERANRTKDEFLAVLSHELRTPLMSILGWSQMLLRPKVPAERARHAVEVIHESARAQTRLIEDLLDVSRILAGKFTIEKNPADLIAIVRTSTESLRPEAEARGIRLSLLIDNEMFVPVEVDETRLRQAISNLIQNAIKFTPAGGRVEISAELSEDTASLRVSDTGRGISPEFLPRIFERFAQADGGAARLYTGLGLGLAIVKHVVEAHGGSISAASKGEGMGSTFTVTLPVEEPARVEAVAEEVLAFSLEGLRILVVEDEPMIQDLIKVILEDEGADVDAASSANEAMDALRRCEYDLLLCDIGLPGRDGYSLIREIRTRGPDRELPAIALSGYGRPEDKSEADTSGFQEHVTKPVDADGLVQRVKALARRTTRARPRCAPEQSLR